MSQDEVKPREFWIEFGGDPSNDKEVYKRYSATVPFEPSSYAEEVVHTIEFKAYEELREENERLRAALEKIHNTPPITPTEKLINKCAFEALSGGEVEE